MTELKAPYPQRFKIKERYLLPKTWMTTNPLDDTKQKAIKHLQNAKGFILICDDGERVYFGTDGFYKNEFLGLIDKYKSMTLEDEGML